MNLILKTAFFNAIGTTLYVAILVTSIFYMPRSFDQSPNLLMPIIMLLLFVFSAAVTGSLVFGRSILWYLEGKKKEALTLLGYTLLILFVIIILITLALSIISFISF